MTKYSKTVFLHKGGGGAEPFSDQEYGLFSILVAVAFDFILSRIGPIASLPLLIDHFTLIRDFIKSTEVNK